MTKTASATTGFGSKLLKALNQVDRPGDVCASGDLPLVLPGLDVQGVGTIRFPLAAAQAGKLIRKCVQAPYGKGTKTLVDTSVRRVWELDPERFELTNPGWDELIAMVVDDVQTALGLGKTRLTAHLYKLLLYDKGSFFKAHRDGEKLDGMVATLVVSLPSPHSGGELVVVHEGRRHKIACGGAASGHLLSYAAFYADCEHEVLPVRDGYRLSLVYNLTLARSRGKKTIAAPRTADTLDSIVALLGNWPPGAEPAKLAIALDHQYSKEGLRIDALKGVDRSRAEMLFDAAEQAGCVAHLALVTKWQSGSAEGGDFYDDYHYRRNRYRRWSYDDDEDEDDDEGDADEAQAGDGTGYEMGEIFDESLSINNWSDRGGNKVAFDEMPLDAGQIVSAQGVDAWELTQEEFEGFTGNAGMTLERWYHRAAVVVWPREHHFAVLCSSGTNAAIAGFEAMVKKWKRARKAEQPSERKSCLQFAGAIIGEWQRRGSRQHYTAGMLGANDAEGDRSRFANLLLELDTPDLFCRFLTQIMPKEGEVRLDKAFLPFGKQHGWSTFAPALARLFEESTAATIERNVELLELLCSKGDKDAARIELCQSLADDLVDAVERIDAGSRKAIGGYVGDFDDDREDRWDAWRVDEIDRAALLASLVRSLLAVEAAEPLSRLIVHSTLEVEQYDLTNAHLTAIFALEPWLTRHLARVEPAIGDWTSYCRLELELRTHSAPRPPEDFRRDAELPCKCGDCRELSRFLADPAAAERRFPMPKDRRQHLHQIIDAKHIDLTHATTRTGRPYTLVCTKTTASFERACEIFARDTENLTHLREVEAKLTKVPKRR
ncbi:MAG: 2OG-Fe(II) oxygenase, partial [Pirellulales bacterium]